MTVDLRALARFGVEPVDGRYVLTLEDVAGGVSRWAVDEEQLDVLADLIDDALGTGSDD